MVNRLSLNVRMLKLLKKLKIYNIIFTAYKFDLPCNLQYLFTLTKNSHQYLTRYIQKKTNIKLVTFTLVL